MRVKIKIDPFGIFIDFQSENEADQKSVYFAYPLYYQYTKRRHKLGELTTCHFDEREKSVATQ
jgi:hypothetical protein